MNDSNLNHLRWVNLINGSNELDKKKTGRKNQRDCNRSIIIVAVKGVIVAAIDRH